MLGTWPGCQSGPLLHKGEGDVGFESVVDFQLEVGDTGLVLTFDVSVKRLNICTAA
jgi:hypothetical protein